MGDRALRRPCGRWLRCGGRHPAWRPSRSLLSVNRGSHPLPNIHPEKDFPYLPDGGDVSEGDGLDLQDSFFYIGAMLNLELDPFPRLETERLALRQMTPGDTPEVHFLRSDPEIMRYIDRPRAKTLEDARVWMDKVEELRMNNEGIVWAVSPKAGDHLIGKVLLWSFKPEDARGELGYVLHGDYQGKGYMGEAVDAALAYGFEVIGMNSVEAQVQPGNAASVRLLEKRGFVQEGLFREYYYFDGQFKDLAIFSLLKKNWSK